ncbi:MAG TPA: hypothetical protein VLL54_16350 [Pyrinomonadaceae bacterium]|nr:hypothetical protein [Pyrinomonadaceae bacterium]
MTQKSWAFRISESLLTMLPDDARAWLDAEQLPPAARFNQRVDPARLLDPSSGAIWGGLMLPDTLPLVSDGGGNALCLRFGFDGAVTEVIHWDHEGSLWKPFGRTLAEALVLDAAFAFLEQIDNDEEPDPLSIAESFPLADWATAWLPGLTQPSLRSLLNDPPNLAARLRELGLDRVAIAQRQCERLLTNRLDRLCRRVGGGKIARSLGVNWSEFRRWLADARLIPGDQRQPISTVTTIPFDDLIYRDWENAALEAMAVLDLRADLAWPFAVLGRYKSEQQDFDAATDYYTLGLETLGTSEDFIANWKALLSNQIKFIPSALASMNRGLPNEKEEYLRLFFSSNAAQSVRDYWVKRGEEAELKEQYELAYRCYYSAGWDLPVQNDIQRILELLENAAASGGYVTLARLAHRHRLACL